MKNTKQIAKEIKRYETIIASATRGQQMMRPGSEGYTESQKAAHAEYQKFIDRAQMRIAILQTELK